MTFRTKLFVSISLAAAAVAGPALAQVTAGATVNDTQGGLVGTIASVDGDFVVLKTDKHEVRLPASSFTKVDDGYLMAMTRDQVNAAVEESRAKIGDLITAGATVRDTRGGLVGTIEEKDPEFATVKLASGTLVTLPVSAFGSGSSGPIIAMTAAELESQAGSAPADAAAEAEAEVEVETTKAQ